MPVLFLIAAWRLLAPPTREPMPNGRRALMVAVGLALALALVPSFRKNVNHPAFGGPAISRTSRRTATRRLHEALCAASDRPGSGSWCACRSGTRPCVRRWMAITAIIGLMARHPLASTTMWGQPYGSPPMPGWAAPFLALLGHTMPVLRLVYFLLGLALIPLAAALAGALDRRAAVPAAPAPCLSAALLPPARVSAAAFYSVILILCGLLLLIAIRLGERLAAEGSPPLGLLLLWGCAGRARPLDASHVGGPSSRGRHLSPVSRAALRPSAAGGRRGGRHERALWWRRCTRRRPCGSSASPGAGRDARAPPRAPAGDASSVDRPARTHTPWVADDPYYLVFAPTALAAALVLLYGTLVAGAAWASRLRGAPGLLLAAAAIAIIAFPFPLRANPSAIRFLTPAYLRSSRRRAGASS